MTRKEEHEGCVIPCMEELYDMAELFKMFSDETRLRLLFLLSFGEKCVQELADELQMTQSAISHQLRILKNGRLVRGRRDGKQIYYSLADDHVGAIMAISREHILEEHS